MTIKENKILIVSIIDIVQTHETFDYMTDYKQTLLDAAKEKLLNGDYNSFSEIISELLDFHITCNCFFRNQPKELWESFRTSVEMLNDNDDDFNLNLTKGFVYLNTKSKELAYKYLSNAIKINPLSNVSFSLRAQIDKEYSSTELSDAEEAVCLKPSARNYFILASCFNPDYANKF